MYVSYLQLFEFDPNSTASAPSGGNLWQVCHYCCSDWHNGQHLRYASDGVFYAELNEFFQRELAEEGYSGVEVRVTPTVTDISEYHAPLLL